MSEARKFDRVPQFDPRSRSFPIRTLVAAKTPRSYTWSCGVHLDQGTEGACVGFGWTHEIAARPKVHPVSTTDAFNIYHRAQQLDAWEGENYDGTSVIGGAKAVQERGYLGEYRWAFGVDDLVLAVGYTGPAVIGVNWYEGMFETDASGYLHDTGSILGGHCLLVKGVNVRKQTFILHNSWGPAWGVNGDAYLTFDTMARLLANQGEACIPVVRL